MTAMQPYPAYRDSGVEWLGEVPEHWEVRRLRTVLAGVTKRNRPDLPLLSVVREKGVILRDVSDSTGNYNYIPDDLSNYKLVRRGWFAINKMKAWQGSFGVSAYDGIVSPAYHIYTVSGVETDFFHVAIRSRAYVPYFSAASDGVRIGQWDLAATRMREIPFVVPTKPEQSRIARFLDHADRRIRRYIRTKERLIELLEEEKQATIHEAVTGRIDVRTGQPYPAYKDSGVEWLGRVPEHWEVAGLGYRYEQCLGKMLDGKRITGEHLVPYLRNIDVQWDKINVADLPQMDIRPDEMPRYTVQPGDLLVCEGGEVGRCAIWRGEIDPCGFQKALHRLRPRDGERDTPRFLYYGLAVAVTSGAFADGHESTIAHLTGEKLRRHRFAFPSTDEQTTIVRYLDATERLSSARRASLLRQIDLLREYRTRLIADVVTGKLDVREAAADLPRTDPLARNRDRADTIPTESKLHPTAHDVVKEAVS